MVKTVSTIRQYTPVVWGNEQEPIAERIIVEHRAPTVAIKEKIFPKVFKYDETGEVSGEFEIDRGKVLREFITEIKNLYVVEDTEKDTRFRIRTADDLMKASIEFEELIDELYKYFQELLNRKFDEKN